jgi:malate dehydrogenase (oxaloacetate-decarboxylating)(NADP+)
MRGWPTRYTQQSMHSISTWALRTVHPCRSQAIKESQLIEAARTIASMVDDDDRQRGRVLPPTSKLREVSRHVAVTVARTSYECKVATALPKPTDLEQAVDAITYDPTYSTFA